MFIRLRRSARPSPPIYVSGASTITVRSSVAALGALLYEVPALPEDIPQYQSHTFTSKNALATTGADLLFSTPEGAVANTPEYNLTSTASRSAVAAQGTTMLFSTPFGAVEDTPSYLVAQSSAVSFTLSVNNPGI